MNPTPSRRDMDILKTNDIGQVRPLAAVERTEANRVLGCNMRSADLFLIVNNGGSNTRSKDIDKCIHSLR